MNALSVAAIGLIALWVPGVRTGLCGGAKAARPVVNVALPPCYCSTADPVGLVSISRGGHAEQRLDREAIVMWCGGPGDLFAVLDVADRVLIYEHHRLIRRARVPGGARLLGFENRRLLMKRGARAWSVDIDSGRKHVARVAAGTVAVIGWRESLVSVAQASSDAVRVFWAGPRSRVVWRVAGMPYGQPNPLLVSDRYLLVATRLPGRSGETYRLAVADGRYRQLHVLPVGGVPLGWAPGTAASHVMVSVAAGSKANRAILLDLDLRTRRFRKLVSIRRPVAFRGLDATGRFAIGVLPYAEVGPGDLVAVDLRSGRIIRIRGNVYDCYVDGR